MRIEKISDTQIRCTLNRADLVSRELKISELAYGTEKAKSLFRDMIQQASYQFGFEADDIPLMIEAIPVSPDCIVLVITKVEDPEELDTRFSKFAPSDEDSDISDDDYDDDNYNSDSLIDTIEDMIDQTDNFTPFPGALDKIKDAKKDKTTASDEDSKEVSVSRLYSFTSFKMVNDAAASIGHQFTGISKLYKNSETGIYYLLLTNDTMSSEAFISSCNRLCEFGKREKYSYATASFLDEHYEPVIKEDAINILYCI